MQNPDKFTARVECCHQQHHPRPVVNVAFSTSTQHNERFLASLLSDHGWRSGGSCPLFSLKDVVRRNWCIWKNAIYFCGFTNISRDYGATNWTCNAMHDILLCRSTRCVHLYI